MFIAEKIVLKQFFKYINSVYRVKEKVNIILDKRKRVSIPLKNTLIIVLVCLMLQYKSFNQMFNYETSRKRMKNFITGRIPRIDAAREILKQVDEEELQEVLDGIVRKIYANKTFRRGTIGGYKVVAIDGLELFNSEKKSCKECLSRERTNGTIEYFHKSVVCMTVGEDPHVVIGEEMLHPRDGSEKDEGELTGGKRLIKRLHKTHNHFADVLVGDALYMNAPFINEVLKTGMEAVIRVKDANRLIVKDAIKLIEREEGKRETFRKGKMEIEAWDISGFEMEGAKTEIRFLQYKEKAIKGEEKTMWVITTSETIDYKIIWEIMHRRWDVENNGFHQLKTYYHADHCYEHEAVEQVFIMNIIAFNLREMYLFKRIKGFRESKMTRIEVSIKLNDDLLLGEYREIWDSG